MRDTFQMSERYRVGVILAMVGGFLDAYTYVCRGGVFVNAQTGNIVLFGINLIEGKFYNAFQYFMPIFSFVLGVLLAELMREKLKEKYFHWRQGVLILEILVLSCVALIPLGNYNIIVNILISFVCSLQVEAFRKFRGNAYVTTMCTGNLRSASDFLYKFLKFRKKENMKKSYMYFGIIVFFIIGGILGAVFTKLLLEKAILIGAFGLIVVFFMLFVDYEKIEKKEKKNVL